MNVFQLVNRPFQDLLTLFLRGEFLNGNQVQVQCEIAISRAISMIVTTNDQEGTCAALTKMFASRGILDRCSIEVDKHNRVLAYLDFPRPVWHHPYLLTCRHEGRYVGETFQEIKEEFARTAPYGEKVFA